MSNKDWSYQEACVLYSKSKDFKLYKAKKLVTERPVAKVRYRCYKYGPVQCLCKEWESRYQMRERKQTILTVKLTCISERLSVSSFSCT